MNFTDAKFWLDAIQFVIMGIIAVILWARKPGENASEALGVLSERVSRIEVALKHIPTDDELQRLDGSIRESNARIEAVSNAQQQMMNQLNILQRFLMDHSK